jgi:shikimate 5-dehydrogenase
VSSTVGSGATRSWPLGRLQACVGPSRLFAVSDQTDRYKDTLGVVRASATVVRDLEGQVALVTGATSGIGKAAAVQLAAQGSTVIVHGRDANRGAAVVAEIENGGGSARFVGAELGDPAEALRLAQEVGDVDILVNNAGFAWFGPSAKLDAKTLDRLFAANVQAP